jgi:hypothetical protein
MRGVDPVLDERVEARGYQDGESNPDSLAGNGF